MKQISQVVYTTPIHNNITKWFNKNQREHIHFHYLFTSCFISSFFNYNPYYTNVCQQLFANFKAI